MAFQKKKKKKEKDLKFYGTIMWAYVFCFQGGLRNSKHESTLSSQEYVHELRSGITEEKLLNCLESLRVSLTSNPVRLVAHMLRFVLVFVLHV